MQTSQARKNDEMLENQEKMNDLMRTSLAQRDAEMRENQDKMTKSIEALLASLMPSDTPPPGTPPKPPPPAPDQQSPTGVAEDIDEDDDNMFTCVGALMSKPPPIVRREFTGDGRAVAAQVELVLGAVPFLKLVKSPCDVVR